MTPITLVTLINQHQWPRPWTVRLQFDPRDFWLGIYWDRHQLKLPCLIRTHNHNKKSCRTGVVTSWHVYLCLLPFLPLHLMLWTNPRETPRGSV